MSAAFDTVDQCILLGRLAYKFGFTEGVLNWFGPYLSQIFLIRGNVSEKLDVPHGVPQGSCLGPLLFTMYASKLFDVIEKHLPVLHCYADDTQLYIAFSPTEETGESDAVSAMEHCIEDICG